MGGPCRSCGSNGKGGLQRARPPAEATSKLACSLPSQRRRQFPYVSKKNARITFKNASKMNDNEKTVDSPTLPRFAVQFGEYVPTVGQIFTEPSMTIPDQSMTIPEIIAKFTRTGLVPGTISMRDKGGNIAADPESDPLDEWNEVQAAAAAAKAAQAAQVPAAPEPEDPAPAPAGA